MAEGVFAAELTKGAAIEHYRLVKRLARVNGRSPDAVRILPGLLLSLGSTEEEARRRSDELHDAGPAAYSVGWQVLQTLTFDPSPKNLQEVLAPGIDKFIHTGFLLAETNAQTLADKVFVNLGLNF